MDVSHLIFADDLLRFTKGSRQSLQTLEHVLAQVVVESGLAIRTKVKFSLVDLVQCVTSSVMRFMLKRTYLFIISDYL